MRIRTRIVSFVSATLACALVALSCRDPGQFEPLAGVAGSYTLTSANGQLPLRYFHTDANGQTTIDITSGTLVLNRNGTFQEILQYHVTPPSPGAPQDRSAEIDGTYRLEGTTLTFTYLPITGAPYSWSGTAGTMSVTYTDPAFPDIAGGLTAVYSK